MVPDRGTKDELNTNKILDLPFSAWHCQQRRGTYYMHMLFITIIMIQQNMAYEAEHPCEGFGYIWETSPGTFSANNMPVLCGMV